MITTYGMKCEDCSTEYEVKTDLDTFKGILAKEKCPECKGTLRQVFGAKATFKGGGWGGNGSMV